MFRFLNQRASIRLRLGLIAGFAAAPIALLLFLFIDDVSTDIQFADRELVGAATLEALWPTVVAEMTGAPIRQGAIGAEQAQLGPRSARAAKAFAEATPQARLQAGVTLMRSVADDSNLTLDTELGSFYAQEAVSVQLPKLMAATLAVSRSSTPQERAVATQQLNDDAAATDETLRAVIENDKSGHALRAMGRLPQMLQTARTGFVATSASARADEIIAQKELVRTIHEAWRIDHDQLSYLLHTRLSRIKRTLGLDLGFAVIALGLAGLLMAETSRGLTRRLDKLLETMARLNQGDTTAEIPFVSDHNETGRIAATLVEFKRRLVEITAQNQQLEFSNAAVRENEAQLRALNWALKAYVRSISALLHEPELNSVLSRVCEAISEDGTYALACVALADPKPDRSLRVVAGAGPAAGYLEDLKLSWSEDVAEGGGPTGRALRSGEPVIMADALSDPSFAAWREKGLQFGVRSSVTIPFSRGASILGVLMVYSAQPDAFGAQEMSLFHQLGEELAFAIALDEDRRRLVESQRAQRESEEAEAEARRRLEKSQEHYKLLTDTVMDVIVRCNLSGIIEFISPAVRQYGFEPEQLIGSHMLAMTHPTEYESRMRVLELAQTGEAPLPRGHFNEFRGLSADGRTVWMQGNPSVIKNEAGEAVGVVTVLRDITLQRELEEELTHKRAEAEAAVAAKAQFLANMSHEIRTPLTGVIGFAGLLDRLAEMPEKARGYTRRIVNAGHALLSLVDDILDFSRIEAGQIQLAPRPLDLAAFFADSIELVRPQADKKGVGLRLDPIIGAPSHILIDATRLGQVLLNLVGNAIKFTPSGTVTVSVSYWGAGGGFLRVAVRDTGVGIAPDQAGRLFKRFSQVDESNTRRYGGAGLGLAISKGLVEALGGEIGVESVEGRGSTFWFTAAAPIASAPVDGDAGEPDDPDLRPMRVLVVDDVAVNRELITTMLSPFDLEVIEAVDGIEAVAAARRSRFDVILMDLQMPKMDGLTATRLIRAGSTRNTTTPILAVSANVLPEHVEACHEAGMSDHIGKPINPQELILKIDRWTSQAAGH